MHVTIADAEVAIAAARKRATEPGARMCIAIVASGASLKAFIRVNDAWVGHPESEDGGLVRHAGWANRQAVAARRLSLWHRTFQRRPESWRRLSEQLPRFDKRSACQN